MSGELGRCPGLAVGAWWQVWLELREQGLSVRSHQGARAGGAGWASEGRWPDPE